MTDIVNLQFRQNGASRSLGCIPIPIKDRFFYWLTQTPVLHPFSS